MSTQERQGRLRTSSRNRTAIGFGAALALLALVAVVAWQSEFFGFASPRSEWEMVYTGEPLVLEAIGTNPEGGEAECRWEWIDLDREAGGFLLDAADAQTTGSDERTDLEWWHCFDADSGRTEIRMLAGRDAEGAWLRGAGLYTTGECTDRLAEPNDARILEADVADLAGSGVRAGSAACMSTSEGALARLIITAIDAGDGPGEQRFTFEVTLWRLA